MGRRGVLRGVRRGDGRPRPERRPDPGVRRGRRAALEEGGLEHAVHETTGEPAEAILAAAGERDSDVIVLAVGDRSPVGKVLFGSVVQGVLLDSDRPVTVVPVRDD